MALIGRGEDIPPISESEFRRYARELWTPTIYNAIKNAKRLTEIRPYSFTESRWRHFAQVSDFPRRLLPIGDAICRFNPVHGQGMSVAAREASVLFDMFITSESGIQIPSDAARYGVTKAAEFALARCKPDISGGSLSG